MASHSVPESPFRTILNFRDVGRTINQLVGSPMLREGLLFRSARLDDASLSDKAALTSSYHIKHIIDLRSESEHIAQSRRYSSNPPASSALAPDTNSSTASPLQIPGITYHLINLNGPSLERALLWNLKWSSMVKLFYLMARGHRTAAISILGTEVMAPRGLFGLCCDTLTHSTSELLSLFHVFSQPASYPILVHCTQGKDRTGILVILLLLLCQVPVAAIASDYLASEKELQPEREKRLEEIRAMGLTDEFAGCQEGFVEGVVEFLQEESGGVEGYLEKIGVKREEREEVRRYLMVGGGDGTI